MIFDTLTQRAEFIPDGPWTIMYIVWIIGGTIFLLLRRRRPTTTLAWILAFWSLPLISGLGYFLFGPRRLDDQSRLRQRARRAAARHVPPPPIELSQEFLDELSLATLGRVSRTECTTEPAPRQAESVKLFADGDSAFPAIFKSIAEACETVHLEYYIWKPDVIGTRMRSALVARAENGVAVRIVVDSIGAKDCHGSFWQPIIDAGGEIRKFNPPHLLKPQPGKLNFRTHRKIAIIDGKIAYTGGINVSDDNLSNESVSGNPAWRSTHLSIEGDPVKDLQSIFLEDWLYSVPVDAVMRGKRESTNLLSRSSEEPEIPEDINRWFPASGSHPASNSKEDKPWVQIVDSGPDEDNEDIHLLFFTAITSAKRRVWITTPYFVPDEPIEKALESAVGRGVDVRLIIPANSDSKLVQAATQTYSADVAAKGAKISLYEPCMNHSKTMIVDNDFSIVGTANMDNRSFRLNFEVVTAIHDSDTTTQLAEMFKRDLESSRPYSSDTENTRLLNRIIANSARLLAPML